MTQKKLNIFPLEARDDKCEMHTFIAIVLHLKYAIYTICTRPHVDMKRLQEPIQTEREHFFLFRLEGVILLKYVKCNLLKINWNKWISFMLIRVYCHPKKIAIKMRRNNCWIQKWWKQDELSHGSTHRRDVRICVVHFCAQCGEFMVFFFSGAKQARSSLSALSTTNFAAATNNSNPYW